MLYPFNLVIFLIFLGTFKSFSIYVQSAICDFRVFFIFVFSSVFSFIFFRDFSFRFEKIKLKTQKLRKKLSVKCVLVSALVNAYLNIKTFIRDTYHTINKKKTKVLQRLVQIRVQKLKELFKRLFKIEFKIVEVSTLSRSRSRFKYDLTCLSLEESLHLAGSSTYYTFSEHSPSQKPWQVDIPSRTRILSWRNNNVVCK